VGDDKTDEDDDDEPECINAGVEGRDDPIDDDVEPEVNERWGRYGLERPSTGSAGSAATGNGLRV